MRKRRHKRYPGAGSKGSKSRISLKARRAPRQGRVSERGRTSEPVAKRRLRSLKRETGGGRKDVLQSRARRS